MSYLTANAKNLIIKLSTERFCEETEFHWKCIDNINHLEVINELLMAGFIYSSFNEHTLFKREVLLLNR